MALPAPPERPPQRHTMRPRLVVSVGGHALAGSDPALAAQQRAAQATFAPLLPWLASHDVVITHGNGPQVGRLLAAAEAAAAEAAAGADAVDGEVSLAICVAESEGSIGYLLAQTLMNLSATAGARRPVATLLTQVVVDADDPAFRQPVKAIGGILAPARAAALRARGVPLRAVPGGYQRLVASPRPVELLDVDVVQRLLEAGAIVIAAGGGGIPVVRRDGRLEGVDAVIDKDLAALALARAIEAAELVIVTDVDSACLHFGTPRSTPIGRITPAAAEALIADGHFAPGSMLPKMQAAARFVAAGGRRAIVCSPRVLADALAGNAGTIVEAAPGSAVAGNRGAAP
jgi:carbamate kinase